MANYCFVEYARQYDSVANTVKIIYQVSTTVNNIQVQTEMTATSQDDLISQINAFDFSTL